MKKLIPLITFFLIIILNGTLVFADSNSSVVKWDAYPSFQLLEVDKNSSIKINEENLIFDFSTKNNSTLGSPKVSISASYGLINKSLEKGKAPFAFSKVGTVNELLRENMDLRVDNTPINYNVHLGTLAEYFEVDENGMSENYNTNHILNSISYGQYLPKHFSKDDNGKLYTIKFDLSGIEDLKTNEDELLLDKLSENEDKVENYTPTGKIRLAFNFDREKTNILTKNFYGTSKYSNGVIELTGYSDDFKNLEIFVLGEDIKEFSFLTYVDGILLEENQNSIYAISTSEQSLKSYLMSYIDTNYPILGNEFLDANNEKIYDIYVQLLDECFSRYYGCLSIIDLIKYGNHERMITLEFEVELDPHSEKNISLNYNNIGSYNKTETYSPIYTYKYITDLNKNWEDFNQINVKVITPKEAPYIIDSNFNLTKGNENTYVSEFKSPQSADLYFSLYKDETISPLSRYTSIYAWAGKYTPLVIILNIFVITSLIILAFKIIKRRRNKKYYWLFSSIFYYH